METIGEDSSGSTASVKAFTDAILKDKDQRTDEMMARDDGLTEGLSHYFEELVEDFDQLERILIARKYETGASVDLFWEQVRFRARWEPDRIRPEHIATALACEFPTEASTDAQCIGSPWSPFVVSHSPPLS